MIQQSVSDWYSLRPPLHVRSICLPRAHSATGPSRVSVLGSRGVTLSPERSACSLRNCFFLKLPIPPKLSTSASASVSSSAYCAILLSRVVLRMRWPWLEVRWRGREAEGTEMRGGKDARSREVQHHLEVPGAFHVGWIITVQLLDCVLRTEHSAV